jgi:acetyl/propionyl-CoA carboxylase alpha subunit
LKVDVRRVLLAARGELAPRLIRSYHAAGLETVIAFASTEASAPYVEEADFDVWIGEGEAAWGDASRVVSAALDAGCDGIHPGMGPLARSLELCSLATASNVGLIGIDAPRGAELLDKDRLHARLRSHKISLAADKAEPLPDDVEVVVVADRHNTVVGLGGFVGHELVEMGPDTASPAAAAAAERVVRALGYVGVGTVVFRNPAKEPDPSTPSFVCFVPNMPRAFALVELVHGIDLIDAQLRVALGDRLGWSPADAAGLDRTGVIAWLSAASDGVVSSISVPSAADGRTELLVGPGVELVPGADRVLAVVCARAKERAAARAALHDVLQRTSVTGLSTNLDRLQRLANASA